MPPWDAELRQQTLSYYNERAPDYEEAYTLGTGTASIPDPEMFKAEAKANRLGILGRCDIAQGDFFGHDLAPHSHDTALVGFFLSHITEAQERVMFETLRTLLDSAGRFLVLDSAWSPERAKFNSKAERQPRQLNDWAREHKCELRIEHFGPAFYAVSGVFSRHSRG